MTVTSLQVFLTVLYINSVFASDIVVTPPLTKNSPIKIELATDEFEVTNTIKMMHPAKGSEVSCVRKIDEKLGKCYLECTVPPGTRQIKLKCDGELATFLEKWGERGYNQMNVNGETKGHIVPCNTCPKIEFDANGVPQSIQFGDNECIWHVIDLTTTHEVKWQMKTGISKGTGLEDLKTATAKFPPFGKWCERYTVTHPKMVEFGFTEQNTQGSKINTWSVVLYPQKSSAAHQDYRNVDQYHDDEMWIDKAERYKDLLTEYAQYISLKKQRKERALARLKGRNMARRNRLKQRERY